jgi:cohesin loading factor subunit SCC2
VRKRVIKVMRDICVQQPTFPKIPEMCALMIKRISDEEAIKVEIHVVNVMHLF